jgi:hypothetical protein
MPSLPLGASARNRLVLWGLHNLSGKAVLVARVTKFTGRIGAESWRGMSCVLCEFVLIVVPPVTIASTVEKQP